MNIYDISKKAGVSIATVSRVINGSANVSEKTRARVLEVIEENGYTPNAFARGLGLNTMKTVGILCADCSDPYLAQAVYHIEQDLRKNNYDSLLCCTGYDLESKQSCMDLLLSKRVDGIVLVGSNYIESNDVNNDYIRSAANNVPIMLVNGKLSAPNIYSTLCDDYRAIYELTELYIKNGKKNIIYLYNSTSYSGTKKAEGFRDAIKAAGIKEDRTVMIKQKSENVINDVKQALAELERKKTKIDGVIASDDILAVGAIKYARSIGRSVPDDMFVTGYNNFDIAQCVDPELTSVDNKLEAICHHCVSTLMGVFGGSSMPKTTVFSAELIKRQTTKF